MKNNYPLIIAPSADVGTFWKWQARNKLAYLFQHLVRHWLVPKVTDMFCSVHEISGTSFHAQDCISVAELLFSMISRASTALFSNEIVNHYAQIKHK